VSRERLWFLRINSAAITPPDVFLLKDQPPFLEHDSWLGCGGDLIAIIEEELLDGLAQQAHARRQGIVSSISADISLRREIIGAIDESPRLTPAQKEVIINELKAYLSG
jgi:hypothetical protein